MSSKDELLKNIEQCRYAELCKEKYNGDIIVGSKEKIKMILTKLNVRYMTSGF